MTYILVVNDDGYDAPGIQALSSAMQQFGQVGLVAPSINQSASGHKKTLFTDIPCKDVVLENGISGLAVGGSPADCIALAALGGYKWPPDLIVSGINRGANMGQDITYSGTVTAALEAAIHGIPAVAFSLDNHGANALADYEGAATVAVAIVEKLLKHPLPSQTILNVNIPAGNGSGHIKGIRVTRQGIREYLDKLAITGEKVYQFVGDPPSGRLDESGTDLWAVDNNYVSVTPIHLDMTAHKFMADLAAWDLEL